MSGETDQNESRGRRLAELAGLFLKLGFTGFGGPAVHIDLMRQEVVQKRGWMSEQDFLDLAAATNLIPGPNSTEMAIHIGLRRAGVRGLVVAGACFILPAVVITTAIAWAYMTWGTLDRLQGLRVGVMPVILGLILAAVIRLAKAMIKDHRMFLLAVVVGAAAYTRWVDEVTALIGGALIGAAWLRLREMADAGQRPPGGMPCLLLGASGPYFTTAPAVTAVVAPALMPWWQVGWFFLKIGTVIYGGGYVLIAFLEGGLVRDHGPLTYQQLLDAVAVGQVTPGPVFTTATFIGYMLTFRAGHPMSGLSGAAAATGGIFLPSFIFVLLLSRFLPRLQKWAWTKAFLEAVNACSIALMAAVLVSLSEKIVWRPPNDVNLTAFLIGLVTVLVSLLWRLNPALLVAGGAAVGMGLRAIGH